MKARVIRTAHSGISAGMTGIVTGEMPGGVAVLFRHVSTYDGFQWRDKPATIYLETHEVELLPDDTCDAPFLPCFALLLPGTGGSSDNLHITV